MKSLAWLGVLLIAGSVVLCGSSNAFAQDPDWYDNTCSGCLLKATGLSAPPDSCDYSGCDPDAVCPSTDTITAEVVGQTVTVEVWNSFVKEREKEIHIFVRGTGATGDPVLSFFKGDNSALGYPESAVEIIGEPVLSNDEGTWEVYVHAIIRPQPDRDVLVFDVPGVDAVEDVTEIWAWSCCTGRTDVPTISEWGVAVMTLLLLSAATVVLMRRRAAMA